MITTLEDLLRAYHDAKRYLIYDTSGSIARDIQVLDLEILHVARELDIVWTGCDCKDIYYSNL